MLYGGLRLCDTSIQVNTNSQVFMGTTRIASTVVPRPFSLHRKRPGYEVS